MVLRSVPERERIGAVVGQRYRPRAHSGPRRDHTGARHPGVEPAHGVGDGGVHDRRLHLIDGPVRVRGTDECGHTRCVRRGRRRPRSVLACRTATGRYREHGYPGRGHIGFEGAVAEPRPTGRVGGRLAEEQVRDRSGDGHGCRVPIGRQQGGSVVRNDADERDRETVHRSLERGQERGVVHHDHGACPICLRIHRFLHPGALTTPHHHDRTVERTRDGDGIASGTDSPCTVGNHEQYRSHGQLRRLVRVLATHRAGWRERDDHPGQRRLRIERGHA